MIRQLTKADIDKILPIERASFKFPWTTTMFVDSFASSYFFGLVWEDEGEIVGYICGDAIFEDAQLMSIATSPNYRKKGIARGLLAAFEEECLNRGAVVCFLEVRISNTPARTLYEGVGYEPIGVRKRYYPDGEDALVMQKTLKEQ